MEERKRSIVRKGMKILALLICVIIMVAAGVMAFQSQYNTIDNPVIRDDFQARIVEIKKSMDEYFEYTDSFYSEYAKLDDITEIVYPSDVQRMKYFLDTSKSTIKYAFRDNYKKYDEALDKEKALLTKLSTVQSDIDKANELMEKASTANNPDKYVKEAQKKLAESEKVYESALSLAEEIKTDRQEVAYDIFVSLINVNEYTVDYLFWGNPSRCEMCEGVPELYDEILKLNETAHDKTLSEDERARAYDELVQRLVVSHYHDLSGYFNTGFYNAVICKYSCDLSYDDCLAVITDEKGNSKSVFQSTDRVMTITFNRGPWYGDYQAAFNYEVQKDGNIKIWCPESENGWPKFLFYSEEEIAKIEKLLNPDEQALEAEKTQFENLEKASKDCYTSLKNVFAAAQEDLGTLYNNPAVQEKELAQVGENLRQAKVLAGLETEEPSDDVLDVVANNSPSVVEDSTDESQVLEEMEDLAVEVQEVEESEVPLAAVSSSAGSKNSMILIMFVAFVLAASTYIGLSLSEKKYEQNPR